MLNIVSGVQRRPQKIVIYGPEGIGKTTLATEFPDPLILDTEGGTSQMDIKRIDKPQSWTELVAIVKEVAETPGICKTFILDTADWAEQYLMKHVCETYKQKSIEAFGYGKGYTYLGEEFAELLEALDKLIAAGINVVITAHAKMRKFEQPDEMGAYDRWEMKLSRQVAPLLKEWSDLLLFCNYQTYDVQSENNKSKAQGGKRVMYTSHHPCWDAKNRHNLPEVVDLSYESIRHIVEPKPQKSYAEQVRQKLTEAGIKEKALLEFTASKGHYPEAKAVEDYPDKFLNGWILKYWDQIVTNISSVKKED